MRLAPVDDVIVVVAGRDGAADDKQENFGQGMGNPPQLAEIGNRRKMPQQAGDARLLDNKRFHHGLRIRPETQQNGDCRQSVTAVNPNSLPATESAGIAARIKLAS